jgi:hypothetical protein
MYRIENTISSIVPWLFLAVETCLPRRLPSSGSFFFHYSGFQPSCHTAPSLRVLAPGSLQMYCHFFSEGPCLWYLIVLMNGISTSCWPRCFCFWSWWHPAVIPHGLGPMMLFSSCSPRAACLKHHPSVADTSFIVLLWLMVSSHHYRHLPWEMDQHYHFSLMGGLGTYPREAVYCLQLTFIQGVDCGTSLPCISTWCLKSTYSSWTWITLNPTMN